MFWTVQRITALALQSEQRKLTLLSAVFGSVLLSTYSALVPLGWLVFFGHFLFFFFKMHPSKYQYNSTADVNIPPSSPFVTTEGLMAFCV